MTAAPAAPHVLLINPNSSAATTQMMLQIAIAKAAGRLGIDTATATRSPTMIVNEAELAASEAEVIALARAARPDCKGIIISAFGDPGVTVLQSELDIPVIGLCEASMIVAAQNGRRFGIATVTPDLAGVIARRAASLGLADLYTGIRCPPGDPLTLARDPAGLQQALAAATRLAIRDGAEAVIIGGGPLGQAAEALQHQYAVPIIAPISSAVRLMIETLERKA